MGKSPGLATCEIPVCRPSGSGALGDHQRNDIARGLVGQMGGARDRHCLDLEPVSCDSSDDCGGRTGGFDRVASEEVVLKRCDDIVGQKQKPRGCYRARSTPDSIDTLHAR